MRTHRGEIRGIEGISVPRGFTLMELVITLMVVAVGVALAVPTYEDIVQRRQNSAKAEELASFLAMARSESVKINEEVSVALTYTNDNDWCIGAQEGDQPCDCTEDDNTAADFCEIDDVEMRISSEAFPKASMDSYTADVAVGNGGFVFDPVRGTKSATDIANDPFHSFIMQSDNTHWALQVGIGPTGRVRVCIPDDDDVTEGFKDTPGFQDCAAVSVPPIIGF